MAKLETIKANPINNKDIKSKNNVITTYLLFNVTIFQSTKKTKSFITK
jgi:hypothetical protein